MPTAMHRIRVLPLLLAGLLASALLAGCGNEDSATPLAPRQAVYADRVLSYAPGTLVIRGSYTDDFGGAHVIEPTQWSVDYGGGPDVTQVVSYDDAQRMLVGFVGTFEDTFGGTPLQDNHSRFDWALYQGAADAEPSLYYCQSYPYVGSAQEAEALPRADDSAPDAGGCGAAGFAWTRLGPPAWPFYFQPQAALGPPGDFASVASLGYDKAAANTPGGSVTVGLGGPADSVGRACAVDEAGADLVVFENPFRTGVLPGGGQGTSNELATVEVSADGVQWYLFPPSIDALNPELSDPARYANFAGVIPVNEGGDRFDLADVIAANPGVLDATFEACYVRLTDGGTRYADFGNTQSDLHSSGADINAVQAVHFASAPGLTP